jgi:hypothetical protein
MSVGLCNGNIKDVNWQRMVPLFIPCIVAISFADTLDCVLIGIFLNAPSYLPVDVVARHSHEIVEPYVSLGLLYVCCTASL